VVTRKLKKIKTPNFLTFDNHDDEVFHLANHSIPAYVCAVLFRDHIDLLTKADKQYCKSIIFEYAQYGFNSTYRYQINDGTHPAIFTLPILFREFSKEKQFIKNLLLLNLFNDHPINIGGNRFYEFAIGAILKLWNNYFEDAQSLLLGFLALKQKYINLRERIRYESHKKMIYDRNEEIAKKTFLKENIDLFEKTINNEISIDDLGDIKKCDLSILQAAFVMIPNGSDHKEHKEITLKIISAFCTPLLSRDHKDRTDYAVRHNFLNKFAFFVLTAEKQDIELYLQPFLDGFNGSESISDLFREFITAEDYLHAYDNFWLVWNTFKDNLVKLCEKGDNYWYVERIVMSYLFANTPWKEKATDWHTLKEENKRFFKKIAEQIGHCPSTLYSLSKLLNNIGSNYLIDGVGWISNMLKNNENFHTIELVSDTIYYIENFSRKYILKNREYIRKTRQAKNEMLIILDFLIEKGSVVGYMLRENII